MTVDNVTRILSKIPGDEWEEVMGVRLGIPWQLREEIQRRYSTDTEKNHAYADYYVNCHPLVTWKRLSEELYLEDEFALAKETKSFMSTGKFFTVYTSLIVNHLPSRSHSDSGQCQSCHGEGKR
ncbi:MAG: hypothetical protein MJE68_26785 [Proteobacteria bacterium]|nr:hypothetical protein [Pseudomonadota bacterium]